MNSILSGERPVVDGHVLSVDGDGRVRADGERVEAGGGVARALTDLVIDGLRADAPERAIAVDQTNTSVIVDDRFVVKIVGEWAAADRAGALLERLAAAGSTDVARLYGAVEWRHPRLGTATLALVTEYLPGAEDGWTWAVDDVLEHLDGAPERGWPARLGAQVARMHAILGADAIPAEADAPARRRARAELALAAAHARLVNRRAALAEAIGTLADTAPGLVFPIHGDLHVGQILASGTPLRYTIIDFDGDPQLDAADRDRPDAAARDVAHLLVSFDLVAAVVQKRRQRAEPAAWAWADRARAAFLGAYLPGLSNPDLFDPALLPAFEAEQLVAELAYADRFLPRWRYAPDAAISHRYASAGEHPETPWAPPPLALR